MKGNQMNESYKVHYPSLKKLTQLKYTDPRVDTDGRTVHAEREGHFYNGEQNVHGHYVVYEDSAMPGSYIGVHIGSELSEDGGEAPINVVAIDKSRSAVINRVSYRARRCKVQEVNEEKTELTEGERMVRNAGIDQIVHAQDPAWGLVDEADDPNPRYELNWEFNPRKGKTYVAISEPYEGDAYYEVPTSAKLRDFDSGGKYDAFVKAIHPKAVASFIFKVKEG